METCPEEKPRRPSPQQHDPAPPEGPQGNLRPERKNNFQSPKGGV